MSREVSVDELISFCEAQASVADGWCKSDVRSESDAEKVVAGLIHGDNFRAILKSLRRIALLERVAEAGEAMRQQAEVFAKTADGEFEKMAVFLAQIAEAGRSGLALHLPTACSALAEDGGTTKEMNLLQASCKAFDSAMAALRDHDKLGKEG